MARFPRLLAASALALCAALPQAAAAQSEVEAPPRGAEPAAGGSILERFGVGRAGRWLESEDAELRQRGIERLGEIGNLAAVGRLTAFAFERRSQLGGREWLTLARALAPHAAEEKAQLVLAMLLNQSPNHSAGPEELALLELARGAAALALADAGDPAALLVLGRALRTSGAPAAAAAGALVAHPPAALAPLLDAPGEPSVELAELLGVLGDQRAFHTLRDWVRGSRTELRAAAALALTRLGHLETVPLGALWASGSQPELRQSGLDILLAAQDARAEAALRELIAAPRLELAEQQRLLDAPSPALADAALGALDAAGAGAPWRWTLLGRMGGEPAARRLVQGLREGPAALSAAHALSRLPGPAAHAALVAALDEGEALPFVLRIAAARRARWGESFAGLDARLSAWVRSERPEERAVAAWVRALGGEGRGELESGDEVRVFAAASVAFVFDDALLARTAELLAGSAPGPLRTAYGVCLLGARARERVPSRVLWSLVGEGGAARPLALRALARRSSPGAGAAIASYLDHPDPLLREHVARGLGESGQPSAVGPLARRFRFETDELVRQAIVIALAELRGQTVSRALDQAARLDPSPSVRAAALLGLHGVKVSDPEHGRELLWTELRRAGATGTAPGDGEAAAGRAPLLLSVGPGLAIPVFADPAGLLVVAGLPPSHLGIRLQ